MASSEIRVCVVCDGKISSLKRAGTKFCSSACGAANKNRLLKVDGLVLVHSCLSDAKHDQFVVGGCVCRKTVTKEDSFDLIKKGECISLTTREYQFDGGPIIYVSGHSKTPRAPTIEANHILYGVGSMAPSKKKSKTQTRAIEELLQLREEERASLAEEARVRWDEYHRLDVAAFQSLIREIPAGEYDRRCKEFDGRQWLGLGGGD
jgi:hypothetical protein